MFSAIRAADMYAKGKVSIPRPHSTRKARYAAAPCARSPTHQSRILPRYTPTVPHPSESNSFRSWRGELRYNSCVPQLQNVPQLCTSAPEDRAHTLARKCYATVGTSRAPPGPAPGGNIERRNCAYTGAKPPRAVSPPASLALRRRALRGEGHGTCVLRAARPPRPHRAARARPPGVSRGALASCARTMLPPPPGGGPTHRRSRARGGGARRGAGPGARRARDA